MKDHALRFGYDIHVEPGLILRPNSIKIWSEKHEGQKGPFSPPFKYMADALVGLSLLKINPYFRSPLFLKDISHSFCDQAWRTLEPHLEIFQRSQLRVNSLKQDHSAAEGIAIENFEKSLAEILDSAIKPWGIDLVALWHLIDSTDFLEEQLRSPLLYNFSIQFKKDTLEKLHVLYSLLFNLRAVIALDHNAHCDDATFEAVKCDAISDYIPKAEYVSHDALLYYQFKKLSHPFVSHRDKDVRIEKLLVRPLEHAFQQYSHNAFCLIENIPAALLSKLNSTELEEAFHLVQMDWLLGSQAGLLFKVREELFGLQNGYEKIFWPDAISLDSSAKLEKKDATLAVSVELKESEVFISRAS